jgi:hypothetical protein
MKSQKTLALQLRLGVIKIVKKYCHNTTAVILITNLFYYTLNNQVSQPNALIS